MKLLFHIALFILIISAVMSCKEKKKENEIATTLCSWKFDFEKPEEFSKSEPSDAYQGKGFTRCGGKINNFSGGLSYVLPDSLNNCTLRIIVDYYARMANENFGQQFVISIQDPTQVIYWRGFIMGRYSSKVNEWIHITDSTQVDYSSKQNNADIRIFGFNQYKKSFFDIDNLHITIKKINKLQ